MPWNYIWFYNDATSLVRNLRGSIKTLETHKIVFSKFFILNASQIKLDLLKRQYSKKSAMIITSDLDYSIYTDLEKIEISNSMDLSNHLRGKNFDIYY